MDEYQDFLKRVSDNVRRMRLERGKTTEEIAFEALGHSSTAFVNQAENLKNGKHFNLKHLYQLAKYYECTVEVFLSDTDI
jgi:transcriptional regulator with XRE-family HTH domain